MKLHEILKDSNHKAKQVFELIDKIFRGIL